MQSSCTLIKMSGLTLEVKKKKRIDQRFTKYFYILERIRTKRGVGKQVKFVANTVEGSGRQHNPSKQNCYINKNISFP